MKDVCAERNRQLMAFDNTLAVMNGRWCSSAEAWIRRPARGRAPRGFETFALTFRYGQRHAAEVEAAAARAQPWARGPRGGGDRPAAFRRLRAHRRHPVPKGRSGGRDRQGHPVTYVRRATRSSSPTRWRGRGARAQDIFIGVTQIDYAGYPTAVRIHGAYERMAISRRRSGSRESEAEDHTPLIHLEQGRDRRPGRLSRRGLRLTLSCYEPTRTARRAAAATRAC